MNNLHRFGLDSAYIKQDTSAASALAQLERARSGSRATPLSPPKKNSSNNNNNTGHSSETSDNGFSDSTLSPIMGQRN